MKILVCGSRLWTNRKAILRELGKFPKGTILVTGGNGEVDLDGNVTSGADLLAEDVGRQLGFEIRVYQADWMKYSKAAGPIRNREMIAKEHPDKDGAPINHGIAFSRAFIPSVCKGTLDCCSVMETAGIFVRRLTE